MENKSSELVSGLHCCSTMTENNKSYLIISPITNSIKDQINVECLSQTEQQYINRYLDDNIFGEYQCG